MPTIKNQKSKNKNGRRSPRAFTIVEALIAGMILAISAAVIGTGVSQAVKVRAQGRDAQQAAELLDRLMTKIDLLGPARLLVEGPTQGRIAGRFEWSAQIEEPLIGDLYTISLELRWAGPTGNRRVRAHTLLNDAPKSRNPILQWEDL